jgi:hypothetical protein
MHMSNDMNHIFILVKLMYLLKLQLDQNLIVIYSKFNSNFKNHIKFGMIRKDGPWH